MELQQNMGKRDEPTRPLQEQYIYDLCKEKATVAIYLTNGIKLVGEIQDFDRHVILLGGASQQIVYKHAISTLQIASEVSGPNSKK